MGLVKQIGENSLPWQDCECGCKGNTLRIGRLEFVSRMYPNTEKPFELSTGHVVGLRIDRYATVEEETAAILARPEVQREMEHIKDMAELFAKI